MVEIGAKPILWHIMKIYSAHGFNDFIVCCGYKGYVIKEYFSNYLLHGSDVTFDLSQRWSHGAPPRTSSHGKSRSSTPATTPRRAAGLPASRTISMTRIFAMTYGDARGRRSTSTALIAFHEQQGTPRDRDRRTASGSLRRTRDRRRPGRRLQGEAAGRRRLDQRRIFRALAAVI